MASTISLRTLVTVSRIKMIPSIKYRGQCQLPWNLHADAYGEDEEGIETHARSKSERFLGIDGHHETTDNRCKSSGGEHGIRRHAHRSKIREDVRVHGQDIGHREESGETGNDFSLDAVLCRIQTEGFLQK